MSDIPSFFDKPLTAKVQSIHDKGNSSDSTNGNDQIDKTMTTGRNLANATNSDEGFPTGALVGTSSSDPEIRAVKSATASSDTRVINPDAPDVNSNSGMSPAVLSGSVAGVALVVLAVGFLVGGKFRKSSRERRATRLEPTSKVFEPVTGQLPIAEGKGHLKNQKSLVDIELGQQQQQQQLQLQQQQQQQPQHELEPPLPAELAKSQSLLATLSDYLWTPPPPPPPPQSQQPLQKAQTMRKFLDEQRSEELPRPPAPNTARDSFGSIIELPTMNYAVPVTTERPKHNLRVTNRVSGGE